MKNNIFVAEYTHGCDSSTVTGVFMARTRTLRMHRLYGVKLEGGPQRLAKMMFASLAHACSQVVNKEVTATEIESSIWAYALHSASLSHATLSMILLI